MTPEQPDWAELLADEILLFADMPGSRLLRREFIAKRLRDLKAKTQGDTIIASQIAIKEALDTGGVGGGDK